MSSSEQIMDTHTLNVLEYPKILELLGNETVSARGNELAFNLKPFSKFELVKQSQRETFEMICLLDSIDGNVIGHIDDIRPALQSASIGKKLTASELQTCANTLRTITYTHKTVTRASSDVPNLNSICANIGNFSEVVKEIERIITPRGEISNYASPRLSTIRTNLISEEQVLNQKANLILKNALARGYAQEDLITERNNRKVIPIKNDFRGQIEGIVHDISASGATAFIEPLTLVELGNSLKELKVAEEREITRILKNTTSLLDTYRLIINEAIEILSFLDLLQAKARLAKQLNCSTPEGNQAWLCKTGKINIKGGKHPLLKDIAVPLDIDVGEDEPCLLITGPNSGGKTVALKTLGLFALMVQSGLLIPCEKGSSFKVYERIFADIGDEQSIEQSLSTFSSHITNIKKIIDESNSNSLVLLDELGAGTDPTEGAALAKGILEVLLERKVTVVATTHHGELKTLALKNNRIRNASVQFDTKTFQPTFKLEIGFPGESNAFSIAKRFGLDEEVLHKASLEITPEQKTIESTFVQIRSELTSAQELKKEASKIKKKLEEEKVELATQRKEFENEYSGLLLEAKSTASEILKKARRILEKTNRTKRSNTSDQNIKISNEILDFSKYLQEISQPIKDDSSLASTGNFINTGDRVYVKDIHQYGEALGKVQADGRVEIAFGSMRIKVATERIEKIERPTQQTLAERFDKSISAKNLSSEVDIRGQRVEEACLSTITIIDNGFNEGLSTIRLIHGKGTGALRAAIRETLNRHPLVKKYESPLGHEGGDGVTIVFLEDN